MLVEGYMDAIAVARAGIGNVVASCGTSLTEPQVKLLSRFTRRIMVNYDPDTAGQAATERSLDAAARKRIRRARAGAAGRRGSRQIHTSERAPRRIAKLLAQAPPYLDYLIGRARQMDRTTREGKVRGGEFSDALRAAHAEPAAALGMGYAHRAELRVDEPVLREASAQGRQLSAAAR